MTTFEYTTNDTTGTIHLIVALTDPLSCHTLCGQSVSSTDKNNQPVWTQGDETQTGLAATCKKCRKLAAAR